MKNNLNKWIEKTKDGDVVIASLVALTRNFADYPFAKRLNPTLATKMIEDVSSLTKTFEARENKSFNASVFGSIKSIERSYLSHIFFTPDYMLKNRATTGLIWTDEEDLSILLNSEDHICIQSMLPGMNMQAAFEYANRIDDCIDEKFKYAYSPQFGYLTSCPSNVGTGLKASYIVFLPALSISERIEQINKEALKVGFSIRGLFGAEFEGLGHLFLISNQRTLGQTEDEILSNLEQILEQTVMMEKNRRNEIINANMLEIEDKVYRSYAVLKYSKILRAKDAVVLLSQLKFGVDTGLVKLVSSSDSNGISKQYETNLVKMMFDLFPGALMKFYKKSAKPIEQDIMRAEYVSEYLPEIVKAYS